MPLNIDNGEIRSIWVTPFDVVELANFIASKKENNLSFRGILDILYADTLFSSINGDWINVQDYERKQRR